VNNFVTINESYILGKIDRSNIEHVWSEVEPWLLQAIEDDGLFGINTIRQQLKTESFQLWVCISRDINGIVAALVSKLTRYTADDIFLELILMGGTEFSAYGRDAMEFINLWAKGQGATRSRILCRPGFVKFLDDFEKKHVVLQKRL